MKQLYTISLAAILLGSTIAAQKTTPTPAKQTVKDTFAIHLLNAVDKLLAMATNEKLTGMDMVGEFVGVSSWENREWFSKVHVPRSQQSTCTHNITNRSAGITDWSWKATISKTAIGKLSTASAKERAEQVLQQFTIKKLQYKGGIFDYSIYETDTDLYIKINYYKGLHNTEQQVLDSLDQLYRPLLLKKEIAGECTKRLERAFFVEGISKDKSLAYFKKLLPQIANTDLAAAFETLMSISSTEDYKILTAELSYSQNEQLRNMGRKVVEDYAAKRQQANQPDVVIAKKKEIEKTQVPTDPCKREIFELALKPGHYISGGGTVGQITSYSCTTHSYTIAWYNASSKRITIAKDVSVASTAGYFIANSAPFMLCRNCKGEGVFEENEWYQVNVASNYYAKSNKTRKIACGECGSRGCIVVR